MEMEQQHADTEQPGTDFPARPAIANEAIGCGNGDDPVGHFQGHAQGNRFRPEPDAAHGKAHDHQRDQHQGQQESAGMGIDEDGGGEEADRQDKLGLRNRNQIPGDGSGERDPRGSSGKRSRPASPGSRSAGSARERCGKPAGWRPAGAGRPTPVGTDREQ